MHFGFTFVVFISGLVRASTELCSLALVREGYKGEASHDETAIYSKHAPACTMVNTRILPPVDR